MKLDLLTSKWESAYEKFLEEGETSIFYHSNAFRRFLKRLLSVEDHYLIAVEGGKIVGALPAVLCRGKVGKCLNSLPFFGSNGGVVEFEGNKKVWQLLINGFFELGKSKECLSSNMISSPFAENPELDIDYDCLDKRIGQISDIRILTDKDSNNEIDHFGAFTRRMIRKARKNSIEVKVENEKNAFEFLKACHYENMDDINGKKKPEFFFHLVMDHFNEGKDYNLWMAYKGSRPVAALLIFYFNRTVEYYIPVIVKEYRSIQPLSLLIYEAMKDASKKGYYYWNWGGTHLDQPGVHRFKKQWNAVNIPYYYYIKVYDNHLFSYSEDLIRREFPYCYLLPFNELNT